MVGIPTYRQRGLSPLNPPDVALAHDQGIGDALQGVSGEFYQGARLGFEEERRQQIAVQKAQQQNEAAYAATELPKVAVTIGEKVNALRANMAADGAGHAEAVQKTVEDAYQPLLEQAESPHLRGLILADRRQAIEREVNAAQERQFGAGQAYKVAPFESPSDSILAIQSASPDTLEQTYEGQVAQKLTLLDRAGIEPVTREKYRQKLIGELSDAAGLARARFTAQNAPLGEVGANAPGLGFDSVANYAVDKLENNPSPIRDINGAWVKFGINQKAHPEVDVPSLTRDQAKAILKRDYWDAIGADRLPGPLAAVAFDAAMVNSPGKAKEWLQQSGGDIARFNDLRRAEFERLAQQNPAKYGPVLRGWENRMRKMTAFGQQQATLARVDGGDEEADAARAAYARNAPYAKPGSYETKLSPEEEKKFERWVTANKVPFDPSDGHADYDMRGYWRDIASKGASETGINANDGKLHYPDTYKTPYHHSFSNESKYATANAPRWINDHQLADKSGKVVFDERAPKGAPAPDLIALNMTAAGRKAADEAAQKIIDQRRDDMRGNLAIAIDQGKAGLADVEAARKQGIIRPGSSDDVTLTKAADEAEKKALEAQQQAQRIRLAAQGIPLDPHSEKDRKALDADFVQQAATWKPEELLARTAAYVKRFGMVPATVQQMVEGGMRSPDPNRRLMAAQMYEQILAAAPASASDFSAQERGMAQAILDYRAKGIELKEALAIIDADARLTPEQAQARNQAFAALTTGAKRKYDLAQEVDRRLRVEAQKGTLSRQAQWSFGPLSGKEGAAFTVPQPMLAEIRQDALTFYRTNGGNMDAAISAAYDAARHAWGPSLTTGTKAFVRDAPEVVFGRPNMTVEKNAEWMMEQAAEWAKAASGHAPKGLTLQVAAGRRKGGRPVYWLMEQRDGLPVNVRNAQGQALYYQPAWQDSEAFKRERRRVADQVRDARRKRDELLHPDESLRPGQSLMAGATP